VLWKCLRKTCFLPSLLLLLYRLYICYYMLYHYFTDVTMLYHSNLTFHKRLYGAFDVDLYNVYLKDLLSTTLCSPIIFLRELAPCLSALTQLQLVRIYVVLLFVFKHFLTSFQFICILVYMLFFTYLLTYSC